MITFPKARIPLLISIPSLSISTVVFVFLCRSGIASSTRWNLNTRKSLFMLVTSMWKVKIVRDLEETLFIAVAAVTIFFDPFSN
uniref:Uncharacterized protein n=1 Tax=Lepeophtheirus salmonis TaxID=72036 RepID=A0A0K2T0N4_LEPSM